MDIVEINFLDIKEELEYINILTKVINKCFEKEEINDKNLYVNILLTSKENIKKINKEHRNIDKETDVLSFPMFEKEELEKRKDLNQDILGDIVICIEKVEEQANEYEHSFERELSYMAVHGFYHLMGYDHIDESDKTIMRQKEETVLNELEILK